MSSPVNNAQLTVTFGKVITTSKYTTTREAFIPHSTNPDLQLSIQVVTYGEEISKELFEADNSPHFISGEIHQSKVDGATQWVIYPTLLFPYVGSNSINIINLTARFGGKFRKSFYSTSADKSGIRDSLAVPTHHTCMDKDNPNSPSNRSWIPVVAYEELAQRIEKYTSSGHLSAISGFLSFREKNGTTYSDIQITRIQFLHSPDRKPDSLEQPEESQDQQSTIG